MFHFPFPYFVCVKFHRFLICALIFAFSLFFASSLVLAQSESKAEVTGIIESQKVNDLNKILLRLLHYQPEKEPKVEELGQTEVRADGSFSFGEIDLKNGERYLMAIFYKGEHFPSRIFFYQGGNPFAFRINFDELYVELPETLKVKGKVVDPAGKVPPKTPVMLLKLDPKKKQGPPVSPVIGSETGENGEFEFPEVKPEADVSYLVGALIGENRFSSKPVPYKGQKELLFLFEKPVENASRVPGSGTGKVPEKVIVTGKLVTSGDTSLAKIPLMILRFNPNSSEGPPVSPVQRSQSDENGGFRIELNDPEPGMSYMVGALVNGSRISSQMQPYTDQEALDFIIQVPAFTDDYSKLRIGANFLVFTPINNGVRVTEVIDLLNTSDKVLFSRENAISKPLPEGAKNFRFFREDETDQESIFQNNRFNLAFQIPPGKSSAFIEYDLERDLFGISMQQHFFPGTPSFQILAKENTLKIIPKDLFMEPESRNISGEPYIAFTANLPEGTSGLNIRLKDLPIPESYFQIAAGILTLVFALIFVAFFFHWRRKINPENPAVSQEA